MEGQGAGCTHKLKHTQKKVTGEKGDRGTTVRNDLILFASCYWQTSSLPLVRLLPDLNSDV